MLELIIEGAEAVGFIRQMGAKRYVDLASPPAPTKGEDADTVSQEIPTTTPPPRDLASASTGPVSVSVGPGIHINIEIHIAADASSETIEEIFRNMRRYVLNRDGQVNDGTTGSE
ncbi:MAG: hypothetical protein GEV03_15215 [Streptosporangiales bacterium]|nr:hypothetical protein [Streptosporangiales bacterium]